MKKYELLKEDRITVVDEDGYEHTLYRIMALIDIPFTAPEEFLGGYIEKEKNLSHEGICWVFGNAKVYDDAQVFDDAWVFGNAQVFNDAQVFGNARAFSDVHIYDDIRIF